jgi:hypothetical protein
MYDTDKYRYAVLDRIRLPLKRTPMGKMLLTNICLVMFTSLTPSSKWVVRWRTRVPIACQQRKGQSFHQSPTHV